MISLRSIGQFSVKIIISSLVIYDATRIYIIKKKLTQRI